MGGGHIVTFESSFFVANMDQEAEPWVVNPGASGKVRTHGGPSCLVLHASEDIWEIEAVLFEDNEAR